jgi:hypothetical protein
LPDYDSTGIDEIKRYIDAALEKQLSAIEQRMMAMLSSTALSAATACSPNPSQVGSPPTPAAQLGASPRGPRPASSSPIAALDRAANCALRPIDEAESNSARQERERKEACENKHDKEVRLREVFMAKVSRSLFQSISTRACTCHSLAVVMWRPSLLMAVQNKGDIRREPGFIHWRTDTSRGPHYSAADSSRGHCHLPAREFPRRVGPHIDLAHLLDCDLSTGSARI